MKGKCKLCEKELKLCKSHIIPEFFYKNIYDYNPNRLCFVKINGSERIKKQEQKGLREYLLCTTCEKDLSVWEKYAEEIIYEKNRKSSLKIVSSKGDENYTINEFNGINYDKFKLFLISILWRISISLEKFNTVVIPGEIVDSLHKALKAKYPLNENQYPCFLQVILNNDNSYFDSTILGPYESAYKEYKTINILIDSFLFCFVLGQIEMNNDIQNIILNRNGLMSIVSKKVNSDPNIMEMIRIMKENYSNK